MTVESTLTKKTYAGNGAATVWPVPFVYARAADLHLVLTDAAGNETPVTGNFQVNVTQAGDTSILYPVSGAPLASGKKLTVHRNTPRKQIVDLQYGGAFSPDTLEHDGFDRLEMQIQELQEESDRAVKVNISSAETAEELKNRLFTARDEAVASAAEQCRDQACGGWSKSREARFVGEGSCSAVGVARGKEGWRLTSVIQ
jgi:hypothetical protein